MKKIWDRTCLFSYSFGLNWYYLTIFFPNYCLFLLWAYQSNPLKTEFYEFNWWQTSETFVVKPVFQTNSSKFQIWPSIKVPGLTWHGNHTMHLKLPYKTTADGNAISFLFFFYGHSMESLSAKKLYGLFLTSMLLCMFIQWFPCFSWNFFYDKQLIYSHSSE